jgi:hypothetical protein
VLFEIGVLGVIVFALAYWTTLFIMGRREDVLHGEFVEANGELSLGSPNPAAPPVIFPPKPVIAPKPVPVASKQVVVPKPASGAATPPPAAVAATPEKPADIEALQSLLISLKQELKNAAQI